MRIQFIIIFTLFTVHSFSQSAPAEDATINFIPVKSVTHFIDSLRNKILADTLKFNRSDIISTTEGNRNINSYSPLFFINILYKYKMDIVSGSDVLNFINEILVTDKIKSVTLLKEPKSLEVFGENGKNGVILIDFKDITKVNLNVAGFKPVRTVGDNFH